MQNGDIIWKFLNPVNYKDMGYGKGPRASVLIHKDKAFGFGARGHAFRLDARNGEKIWFRASAKMHAPGTKSESLVFMD